MAQQIQFIYLTQSDYDGLTPQTSKIYFTSDTKRIYKGVDLYAATTFDQLNFSAIEASSITVDGSAVSLEGHSHSMSDISGLDSAISAATSNFATWGHQHVIADVTNLPGIVSGITTTGITKSNGNFTNLNATSIQASAMNVTGAGTFSSVSASTATFGNLVVTGDVSMTLSQVTFGSIMASDIQVNGSAVSLEGHSHSASEISGLDAMISAATSSFALTGHTHNISDITSLATKVSGLTSNKVEKTNGVFTNLSTTNLVVSSATIDAISIEASSMTVNGTGTFNAVSASTATFGDINVTGTASLSTTNVTASTLTAGAGSFTTLTVGGSNVALVGHTHSVADIDGLSTVLNGFASSGHTHGELTGITQTSISKANANFTTLSASAGTFNTITTSDLNLTNLSISSAVVSSMTVANLNVTNTLKLNNKDIATQEYVQTMISQAIGQILASAY